MYLLKLFFLYFCLYITNFIVFEYTAILCHEIITGAVVLACIGKCKTIKIILVHG